MRIWRAYGIGQGKLIPYQDLIVKPQGPIGLVVNEIFSLLKAARLYKSTINSDGEKSNSLVLSQATTWFLKNAVN